MGTLGSIRDDWFLKLNGKIFYDFPLYGNLVLKPFIGFSQFGGKQQELSNHFTDEVILSAWEFGFLPTYQIDNFQIGLGVKFNKHAKMVIRSKGTVLGTNNSNEKWEELNPDFLLKKLFLRLGF